jgi:hypothetical protein
MFETIEAARQARQEHIEETGHWNITITVYNRNETGRLG